MKQILIVALLIGLSLFLGLFLTGKQQKNQNLPINKTIINTTPSRVVERKNEYTFSGEIPSKNVKLRNFYKDDFRTITVFIFDDKLMEMKGKNGNFLIIKNPENPETQEYKIYSDLELLSGMKNGTARLDGNPVKNIIEIKSGNRRLQLEYFETYSDLRLLRKYLFNYGDTDYLISVEMPIIKKDYYINLTNKILATMIPETVTMDYFNKLMNELEKQL